jgi:hypothetical protein
LNGILHIGYVDLKTGGLLPVHDEIEVGLTDDAKDAEVLDSPNALHNAKNLLGFGLKDSQVITVDLRGKLPLDPARRFFHVVLNGLGEVPDRARDLFELAIHGGNESLFILVKDGAPLTLGL